MRRTPLSGGRSLVIREVMAGDVDGLATLYEGLSADDRRRRFFSSYRPDRPFLQRAAAAADRDGLGLVAVVTDPAGGEHLVAEAGYEILPNGDGELAMTVAEGWRGWLGPYMFDALVDAAAARGVPNLEARVLVTNARMLMLLRSRGYATLPTDDWVSVRVMIGTAGRAPVWPVRLDRPRVLVETLGGRWHGAADAGDAGLEVIMCSGPRARRGRCPVLAGRPCPLVTGADAVVVSHTVDDHQWDDIVAAHHRLHPGVPVCVELRPGHAPQGGPPTVGGLIATEAANPYADVTVACGDGDGHIVAVVDRLARQHRRRQTGPGS